ncbi:MAG: hypothetical protein AB8G23_13755 [Myxococcota bacterium]
MDIGSAQRLAAYTADLGIESARAKRAPETQAANSPRRAQRSQPESSGIKLSLSARAQAQSNPEAGSAATTASADSLETAASDSSATFTPLSENRDRNGTDASNRSNRSVAISAYQKISAPEPGSRVQVIA